MSRNELLLSVLIYFELHERELTGKEYRTDPDAPVPFRTLQRHFGSWRRVISRLQTVYGARYNALSRTVAELNEIEEEDQVVIVPENGQEGTLTAAEALRLLLSKP